MLGVRLLNGGSRVMGGRKKKRLSMTLGWTMFIHGKGASLSPRIENCQNTYRGKWDGAPYKGRNDFCAPQGKLEDVGQQETVTRYRVLLVTQSRGEHI